VRSASLTLGALPTPTQAAYEFTTLTCIPGVVHYRDAKIQARAQSRASSCFGCAAARLLRQPHDHIPRALQLLDLPGIIEGASEGKGRGRQVIAVAKSADLILMVLDASKSDAHKAILTRELEAVGIRLNRSPPQITYKKKKTGGISISSTVRRCADRCLHRESRTHSALHMVRDIAVRVRPARARRWR
jgi:ribosome-interacting GTPase 1